MLDWKEFAIGPDTKYQHNDIFDHLLCANNN